MKLIIRKMRYEDIQRVNKIRNLSSEWLHHDIKFTEEETKKWFTEFRPDWWSIVNEENDLIIGYFRLSDWSKSNKNLYIGADLHPDFRGKGIASRLYPIFMKFLFVDRGLHKITLEVLSLNSRAHSLYKKLGFVQEGVKRQEIFRDGLYLDSIIMSILRDEFFENYREYDGQITVHKDM